MSFDIIIIGSGPSAGGFLYHLLNSESFSKTKRVLIIERGGNAVYDRNDQDLTNVERISCASDIKNQHLRARTVGGGATINASIYVAPSIKEIDTCFPNIAPNIRNTAYTSYKNALDSHIFKNKHESGFYLYQYQFYTLPPYQ